MDEQFSAAFYSGWSRNELVAEAAKLGLSGIDHLNGNRLIDAIYNAELRRRQVELEAAEKAGQSYEWNLQGGEPVAGNQTQPVEPPDYDSMTAKQLRELADSRGIDHSEAKTKAEVIELLELADLDNEG